MSEAVKFPPTQLQDPGPMVARAAIRGLTTDPVRELRLRVEDLEEEVRAQGKHIRKLIEITDALFKLLPD